MYPLLSVKELRLPQRKAILHALDLYVTYNIDFEDAIVVAQMEQQGINELYSYDRGFEQVLGVVRHEP